MKYSSILCAVAAGFTAAAPADPTSAADSTQVEQQAQGPYGDLSSWIDEHCRINNLSAQNCDDIRHGRVGDVEENFKEKADANRAEAAVPSTQKEQKKEKKEEPKEEKKEEPKEAAPIPTQAGRQGWRENKRQNTKICVDLGLFHAVACQNLVDNCAPRHAKVAEEDCVDRFKKSCNFEVLTKLTQCYFGPNGDPKPKDDYAKDSECQANVQRDSESCENVRDVIAWGIRRRV